MKQPYKRPFVVFTVFAFLMFALLAAAIVLIPILVAGVNVLDFVTNLYFNKATFEVLLDFNNPNLMLLISFGVAILIAVAILVLLFVALFGIRKKTGAKIVGIILAVFGLAVAYFGGTMLINSVYSVDVLAGSTGDAWIGIVNVIQNGTFDLPAILMMVFDGVVILATIFFIVFAYAAVVNAVKYAHQALAKDVDVAQDHIPEQVEEPVLEEEPEEAVPEEMPVFIPEPEDDSVDPQNLSTTALAAIIKDVVREIVRDELERNNLLRKDGDDGKPVDSHTDNRSIVGATFGGPLIVQYFNGGIQGANPVPAPAPKEEPKEEVVEEDEPKEEEPAEKPMPVEKAPVEAADKPAVVEEPAKVAEPEEPKTPVVRIPFDERLLGSDKELQEIYNEIKNEILSYGVKSRISTSGDTFRLHRKTYVKITVAGKSLKLYFALNPDNYRDTAIPVQDASEKNIYEEIPLVFKVKSPLSVRRCKQLIQDVMEQDGLEQGEVGTVNWIKEMKAELKARGKSGK